MRVHPLLVILLLAICSTSCVPLKDINYLQDKESVATDSILRVQREFKDYRLQVGDQISIRIKALDQDLVDMFSPISSLRGGNVQLTESQLYSSGFTLDPKGNIRVPTLGNVSLLGKTLEEARIHLEEVEIPKYFKKEAEIFLTVRLAGLKFTTMGEIGNTGSQVIFKDRVNLAEAIAQSGDIPITGDKTAIRIVRQYPDGYKTHTVDITDIQIVNSPYFFVQPNDIIIVDALPQKSIGTGTTGLQTFTTVASIITTAVSLVLLAISLSN